MRPLRAFFFDLLLLLEVAAELWEVAVDEGTAAEPGGLERDAEGAEGAVPESESELSEPYPASPSMVCARTRGEKRGG